MSMMLPSNPLAAPSPLAPGVRRREPRHGPRRRCWGPDVAPENHGKDMGKNMGKGEITELSMEDEWENHLFFVRIFQCHVFLPEARG